MPRIRIHLSDEELLLFSDQELPTRQAARVREHVARCEPCRRRLTNIEEASACFSDLHEQEIRAQNSHSLNSRNLLKGRLAEVSMRGGGSPPATLRGSIGHQLVSACLALLLVAAGTWTVRRIAKARSSSGSTNAEVIALPRQSLTPGATRAVQLADLCSNQDLNNDPPVDVSLEQAVFKEYGVPASSKGNYELDYLITPSLGGSDSIQNLWPQPYSSTWNAHVKDQLEDHLHELVCHGKVQLAKAQNDIASDWITAYKTYFNTDEPKRNSSAIASIRPKMSWNRVIGSSPSPDFQPFMISHWGAPDWQFPTPTASLRRAEWLR